MLAALALPAAAAAVHADERPIVIRLYDIATGDAEGRAAAMRLVAAMMADAGVSVDWRDCSRGGDAHPCRTVRGAHDLVVRDHAGFRPASGRRGARTRTATAICSSASPRWILPARAT